MQLTTPLLGIITLAAACSAQAAFVATISQVGNDVVLTGSGSFNITGFEKADAAPLPLSGGLIAGEWAAFVNGEDGDSYQSFLSSTIVGPDNFGIGGGYGGVGQGDVFGIQGSLGYAIFLDENYVSGSFLSGSSIFADTTLEDLGLTAGVYVWNWGEGVNADSLTLTIAVPEPAHYAIGAGVAALALVALRRRSK